MFAAHRYRPWAAIRRLRKKRIPIIILQADKESTAQPDTDVRVHAIRPDAAVTSVPGTTHFMPMERPYVVRDALKLLYEATIEGAHGSTMSAPYAARSTTASGSWGEGDPARSIQSIDSSDERRSASDGRAASATDSPHITPALTQASFGQRWCIQNHWSGASRMRSSTNWLMRRTVL